MDEPVKSAAAKITRIPRISSNLSSTNHCILLALERLF